MNKDLSSSWMSFQVFDDFQIQPKKLDNFDPPKCLPICENHKTVKNGHVTCTGGNVTDTCSITCDNGYNLINGTALFYMVKLSFFINMSGKIKFEPKKVIL